jgi:hypothetical protein
MINDPLKPVVGQDGRMITAVVNQATLPKTPVAPKPDLYPGSVVEPELYPGSVVEPQIPAAAPTTDQYPGSVIEQPAQPVQPGFTPWTTPPPEPVQVDPQRAGLETAITTAPAENWKDALREGAKTLSFLPFSDVTQVVDAAELLRLSGKVGRGEATYQDEEKLNDYLMEAQSPKTFGYGVIQNIMKLPAFALELGMTGGVYTAGKKITMTAMRKALAKYAESKAGKAAIWAAERAGGVAAQTAASSAQRVATGTIQNVTPTTGLNFEPGDENFKVTQDQDSAVKALARSFAEQALQVGSERVGNLLDKTPPGKVFQAALRRYLKINPGKRVEDFMDVVRDKGLRNSFVSETIEEEIIKPVEVLTGVGTQTRGDENTMANRVKEQYSWKQLLQQSAILAVPGAGGVVVNKLFSGKPPTKPTADDFRTRIESLGIPKDQIGDFPDRMAAAKTPEERDAVVAEFANTFKDTIPVDPIIQNQTEHMTGEIAKVTDPTAVKYFEDTYLSQLQSGQPLTEEQTNAAHTGILDAIEKAKAGQAWTPPVEPVQPVVAPNLPPPAPTTQTKVENPAPVPAGEPVTQPIIEAPAGAIPLTSPTIPTTKKAPTSAGPTPIKSPGVGAGTISKKETLEERRAAASGQEITGLQFIKDNGGIEGGLDKDLSEELFGVKGKNGPVDITLRGKGKGKSVDVMASMMQAEGFLPTSTDKTPTQHLLDYLNDPNTKLTKAQLDLQDKQQTDRQQGIIDQGTEAEKLAPVQAKKFSEAQARLKTKGQEVSTPMMEVGDSFTIEGERYKVTDTDDQGFRVEDGTTFWIPYKRPAKGERIFVDKGSYKMVPLNNDEISVANRRSRSQSPAKGIPQKQAQYLADEMMKAWVNKPMGGAIVVQSEADIDKLGLSDESRQAILDSKAEGFYHIPTETVVIIADNLNRPSDAIRVMIHESIGHYGIRKVLGTEFESELDRIGKLIPEADLQKVADDYNLNMADPAKRLEAIEEYLAKEAPLRNPTLWQQFVKAIRAALERIGVKQDILNKWDTRGEIEKLIDTARDYMERGPAKPSEAMSGEVRMSKPEPDTREFKLEKETIDQWRSRATLEKQNAEAKRQSDLLKAKAAEPIKGGMGDRTGSLFKGETDLFGIRMSLREHGPSKHISEDEKIAPAIRKMALDMEYEQRDNKELFATVEKRVSDNLAQAHDDFINNKNLLPDELVVTGKILQFRYSESTLTAEDTGDIPLAQKYAKAAHEITKALNEYALQYGRAGEAFRIETAPLSSRTGARTKLEGMNEDYAKEIMKKDGRFEVVRKGFQEDNAKAIDEVLVDKMARQKLADFIHRIALRECAGIDKKINDPKFRQSVQEYRSNPAHTPANAEGIRFSTEPNLDRKIEIAADFGIGVFMENGHTGFEAFKAAMVKQFGANIEEHLPLIYDESRITLARAGAQGKKAKGTDTRATRTLQSQAKTILKEWFAADAYRDRQPVLSRLQEELGMTKEDAAHLGMFIQNKFIKRATKLKEKRVQALGTGRGVSINNPKAIRRILDLSNLGPLNEPMVLDAIAKAYNLKGVTPEIGAKLDELSKKIKNAPEGSPTDDATREMLNFMRKQMPRDWADMGWGVWYANILSGYQTEERNFVGTAMNSLSDLTSSITAEPRNAPFALAGFIRGFGEGFYAAVDVWKTGNFPVRAGKFESSQVLELNPFTGGLKILNNMKYVLRLLQASDMLFFKASQESRAMMIAANVAREQGLSGSALWKEVALIAGTSNIQRSAFMRQATELEGRSGSAAKVRAQELAERQRPLAMQEESTEYGKHSSLNYDPEGMAGVISRKVSDLVREVPLGKFVIPFTRIVANVSNISIDHTPWGFIRLLRGIKNSKGVLEPITGHRRTQLVAKAIMGTALMTATYMLDAMGGDDDKKRLFQITGAGSGNFNKDNQMKETGWRPWSFKIKNGPWIDYRLTPLAIGFAIIGSLRDAQRYKKMDEKTIWDRFSYALLKSTDVVFNMSFLSGINQVLSLIAPGSPEGSGKKLSSYLTRIGSSIAVPAILKQLDRTFDDSVRDNATIAEGLMREVPIVSHSVRPKLNLLGEPVKQTASPTSIFFSKENSDPVWRLIVDKEAFISKPATSTEIGFRENKRPMNEDEYYDYVKDSGVLIREQLERRLPQLQGMTKERAGKVIDDITQNARERVKNQIQRKAWSK